MQLFFSNLFFTHSVCWSSTTIIFFKKRVDNHQILQIIRESLLCQDKEQAKTTTAPSHCGLSQSLHSQQENSLWHVTSERQRAINISVVGSRYRVYSCTGYRVQGTGCTRYKTKTSFKRFPHFWCTEDTGHPKKGSCQSKFVVRFDSINKSQILL